MAWSIPTLEDLAQRTRTAFTTYLPASASDVWPNPIPVAAKVFASRMFELFNRQAWIARQSYPLTADGEYLERHAQAYGINRQSDLLASGEVSLTGGTHTTLIPAGTQYQDSTGLIYATTESVYIDSNGEATIPVQATATGTNYHQAASASLTLLAVIAGVPTTATVTSEGIYGGTSLEADEDLRSRLLQRLRNPPNAGSKTDYERWARDITGVTRVWVEGNAYGPGTVGVWFTMDNTYTDGIPLAADVTAVQTYIDTVKPITANVTVAAPIREPLSISISGISPFTTNVVDNIKAELAAAIAQKAEVSTPQTVQYFRESWVWQAVSNATGERYHTVNSPNGDFAIPSGRLPVYDEGFITLTA